jgi:hypothetical protein
MALATGGQTVNQDQNYAKIDSPKTLSSSESVVSLISVGRLFKSVISVTTPTPGPVLLTGNKDSMGSPPPPPSMPPMSSLPPLLLLIVNADSTGRQSLTVWFDCYGNQHGSCPPAATVDNFHDTKNVS